MNLIFFFNILYINYVIARKDYHNETNMTSFWVARLMFAYFYVPLQKFVTCH